MNIKAIKLIVPFIAFLLLLGACGASTEEEQVVLSKYQSFINDVVTQDDVDSIAVIDTDKGMMAIELYENQAPLTVRNFINLVEANFYDGLNFHLVRPDFAIQTGDPTGIGTGDSGTTPITLEIHPDLKHDKAGIVGMARREDDPNSATSQFYITLASLPDLDRRYAIFGKVVKGIEVVPTIQRFDIINDIVIIKK